MKCISHACLTTRCDRRERQRRWKVDQLVSWHFAVDSVASSSHRAVINFQWSRRRHIIQLPLLSLFVVTLVTIDNKTFIECWNDREWDKYQFQSISEDCRHSHRFYLARILSDSHHDSQHRFYYKIMQINFCLGQKGPSPFRRVSFLFRLQLFKETRRFEEDRKFRNFFLKCFSPKIFDCVPKKINPVTARGSHCVWQSTLRLILNLETVSMTITQHKNRERRNLLHYSAATHDAFPEVNTRTTAARCAVEEE